MDRKRATSARGGRGGRGRGNGRPKRVVIPWADAQLSDGERDAKRATTRPEPPLIRAPPKRKAKNAATAFVNATGGAQKTSSRWGDASDDDEEEEKASIAKFTRPPKAAKPKTPKTSSAPQPPDAQQTPVVAPSAGGDEQTGKSEKRARKKEKKTLSKQEKLERSRFGASVALTEQKQREEKKRKKKAKRLAKLAERAQKKADVDGEDDVDDDVAFDSDEVASSSSGGEGDDFTGSHGFVMIDLETDVDELAMLADLASSSGGRVGRKMLQRIAKIEMMKNKSDRRTKERIEAAARAEIATAAHEEEEEEMARDAQNRKKKKKQATRAKKKSKKSTVDGSKSVGGADVDDEDKEDTTGQREVSGAVNGEEKALAGGEFDPKPAAPKNEKKNGKTKKTKALESVDTGASDKGDKRSGTVKPKELKAAKPNAAKTVIRPSSTSPTAIAPPSPIGGKVGVKLSSKIGVKVDAKVGGKKERKRAKKLAVAAAVSAAETTGAGSRHEVAAEAQPEIQALADVSSKRAKQAKTQKGVIKTKAGADSDVAALIIPPPVAAQHASNSAIVKVADADAVSARILKPVSKKTAAKARREEQRLQKFAERAERRNERGRKAKHANTGESERGDAEEEAHDAIESKEKKRNDYLPVYEEYVARDLVMKGLETGVYFQGRLRVNAKYRHDGYVSVDGIAVDVLVKGMEDRNRAFDGDVVAIQLHPESEWHPLKASEEKKLVALKPMSSSAPIDEKKLHSLWLPSVDTSKCFVDRPNETAVSGSDSEVQKHTAAIIAKIAELNLRPTAKVVHILVQGNTQGFIGSLEPKTKPANASTPLSSDDAYAFFNAHDERLPRRIQIPRLQLPDEFVSHPLTYAKTMLCFCRIKTWGTKYMRPAGEFVKTLGEFTGIESGISAILTKHGLQSHTLDFASEILNDLDTQYGVSGEKWTIPDEELQKRRDFRESQIFSIDPYNARDLDDALHIRALNAERTKFEIGVHIADVTHFIEEGSLLDQEAQDRATSVYLVNRVLPMLPRVLCEKLCSLQPQVDRLAFSVVWQMNADGSLVDGCDPWFGKSIIRSCCKLDYGSAQRMLDGDITSEKLELWEAERRPIAGANPLITNASVIQSVKDLWTVGKRRRESRFDTGAISLNNVKLVFTLDAKGNPERFGSYQLKDSNRLVEEYMLLANYLVAQQLLRAHGPLAFIRNHPQPAGPAMEQAVDQLHENKLELDSSSARSLSESLERLRAEHGEVAYMIAQAMIIKPMQPAEYMVAGNGASPEAWRHYALNIPYYTHFTSPIRRYADVVVHRLLQESLTCGDVLPVDDPSRDVSKTLLAFTAVSQNCNEKKVTAKHAETECDLVFLCAYVKHHGAVEVTGVVMSVGPQSFTVYIMELGLEERIALSHAGLTGTWDENASTLAICKRSKRKASNKEGEDATKPVQLAFMKKLRLLMSATETMPLKLKFTLLGE